MTRIVKSKLSESPGAQHLFTRSGNQDNGAAIMNININEFHLKGGLLLPQKNTKTHMYGCYDRNQYFILRKTSELTGFQSENGL